MYIPELKFSLWADFIERDFLEGEFKQMIEKKIINGATSNPAIFKNAILTSAAYKQQIASLKDIGAKEIYEAVAIYDIQKAADALLPLHVKGDDGYVSIEIDPFLCDNADESIKEGKRLYTQIDRPNVMIKVPATKAGYIVMEALVAEGIAVNATLVFKKEQAVACAEAFKRGALVGKKEVDSVISVFVSRIDRALDDNLKALGIVTSLSGIYNAADIYSTIESLHVKRCRTLFASTGVKGDTLKKAYYISALLAKNSVNTAPIDTIYAFIEDDDKSAKLPIDKKTIQEHFLLIERAGIDFDAILDRQIEDGLDAFKVAFSEILQALEV